MRFILIDDGCNRATRPKRASAISVILASEATWTHRYRKRLGVARIDADAQAGRSHRLYPAGGSNFTDPAENRRYSITAMTAPAAAAAANAAADMP